jgi:hypothetical protein
VSLARNDHQPWLSESQDGRTPAVFAFLLYRGIPTFGEDEPASRSRIAQLLGLKKIAFRR